jgi:sugar phosphate isomerase/epimerase
MGVVSRRDFLVGSLPGAAYLSAAPSRHGFAMISPLGFQIYSVRERVAKDLSGTLKQVAAMGYEAVELCSFKGFAGDKLKGDFGPLADMKAADVRRIIQGARMTAASCHFNPWELEDQRVNASIEWAAEVGVTYMTIGPAISNADKTMDEWKQTFDILNRYGECLRKAGRRLGYHPQAEVWKEVDGVLAFDEMLRKVDPENCQYELDVSTSHVSGIDAGGYMTNHPGRFFAVHLRDLKVPRRPTPYIFALPLGQGEVDWVKVLRGAKRGAVGNYIVEMVVEPPADPMEALRISTEYLRSLKV